MDCISRDELYEEEDGIDCQKDENPCGLGGRHACVDLAELLCIGG